jgi:CRISPR/Cas system-associated exonuclease Cas4 (RecB family)
MSDIKYRLYPTLLNEFGKYLGSPTLEMRTSLLNRINRVRDFDDATLKRMKKGSNFEDAVLKNKPHAFENKIVEEVRNMLPTARVEQMPIKFTHQNIQFYGFADVVGEGKVIDIKTTSSYRPHKFQYNFQNLYMYALKDKGCSSMEYIIYDFKEIHIETYPLATYDFSAMLHHMELFTEFLEENRQFITDKKIFVEEVSGGLFG